MKSSLAAIVCRRTAASGNVEVRCFMLVMSYSLFLLLMQSVALGEIYNTLPLQPRVKHYYYLLLLSNYDFLPNFCRFSKELIALTRQ